jgi:hypothetical protein
MTYLVETDPFHPLGTRVVVEAKSAEYCAPRSGDDRYSVLAVALYLPHHRLASAVYLEYNHQLCFRPRRQSERNANAARKPNGTLRYVPLLVRVARGAAIRLERSETARPPTLYTPVQGLL